MIKTNIVLFLLAFVLLLNGCETAKGFSKGMGSTVYDTGYGLGSTVYGATYGLGSTVVYTTEGAVKDSITGKNSVVKVISRIDNWIKDNLW